MSDAVCIFKSNMTEKLNKKAQHKASYPIQSELLSNTTEFNHDQILYRLLKQNGVMRYTLVHIQLIAEAF